MRFKVHNIYIVATIVSTMLTISTMIGCAPKLATTDDTPPTNWIYGGAYPTDSLRLGEKWWEIFSDTTLNRLIDRALIYNRDIEATAATLEAAQRNVRVVRSEYLPSLSFNAEVEGYNNASSYNKAVQEYTIGPTIEWEVSLFGALKQSSRKARAEVAESQWALRAIRLSIAAEVATTFFTLRQAQSNLNISKRSYELRAQESMLIDSMFYYGMSDGVAREQARSLLYTSLADIAQYRRAVEQTRLTLGSLVGENPDPTLGGDLSLDSPMEFSTAHIPATIPIGLPSDLLERRADIQQSYYTMEAAAAAVGIARAARYPTISLTGSGGLFGYALKDLTSGKPWAWSATGEIAETIFNFGGLKSREKAARAEYMESLYKYEQSMLTAFAEVEQQLVAIESYGEQRGAMVDLVIANASISRSTNALYDNGMNDYLNVIDAERELYSSQMELIEVITNQYISYINLFKALGGGY